MSNENNQYADHAGIELLYASVLCRKRAQAANEAGGESEAAAAAELAFYASVRLLAWLPALRVAVEDAAPGGYLSRLLALALALLDEVMTR